METKGIISEALEWVEHPYHSSASLLDWSMGLVAILALAFLWATVVNLISE